MKRIFLFLAVIGSLNLSAQVLQKQSSYGFEWNRGLFTTYLGVPKGLGGTGVAQAGYDTASLRYNVSDSSLYTWTGYQWRKVGGGGSSSSWSLTGDAGTTSVNFIGTTDAQPLVFRVNNAEMGRFDTATYSVALGINTVASGEYSTAIGRSAISSGIGSLASGESSFANGEYSTAIGYGLTASGNNSVAMGVGTTSIGQSSTAIGESTTAIADYSTAMGLATFAKGYGSTVMGISNKSKSYAGTVIGIGNDTADAVSQSVFDLENRAFQIGIGATNPQGQNAMTVLFNGNTGIGTTTPTATLHLINTFRYQDGNEANGKVLTSDANGNATWQMGGGSIDTTNFANIWLSNTFQANQIINGGDGDEPITLGSLDGDNYGLWNVTDKKIATFKNADNTYNYASDNIIYDANAGSLTLNNNIYLQNVSASTYTGKSIVLIDGASSNKLSSITVDSFALASKLKSDSSTIMTAVNLKAPLASPTFTGTVTMPTPFTLGATSVTTTAAQLNYSNTVTSNIQTQLNAKLEDEDKTKTYQALGSGILAENPFVDQTIGGTSNALSDGRCYFSPVYLSKAATITGVKWLQRVTGSYTADNENRIGLYTYSAGTMTLVASCANDGTLWQTVGTSTYGSKAFTGTYSASAGLYFVGALYNSSAQTTAPTVGGSTVSVAAQNTIDFTNSAKLSSYVTTATLPTSQAMSGTTTTGTLLYSFSIY